MGGAAPAGPRRPHRGDRSAAPGGAGGRGRGRQGLRRWRGGCVLLLAPEGRRDAMEEVARSLGMEALAFDFAPSGLSVSDDAGGNGS